ncbi:MAG: hypothetical protein RR441_08040 [Longicatena sp.]
MEKKIHKLWLYLPVLLLCGVICFLIYDFLLIKDVSITRKSGNYIVVLSEDAKDKNTLDEMRVTEKEIVELLKNNSIDSKVSTVFYPDLPAFVYYKNSERRKPYNIKVANNAFFQNLNIAQPKTNVMYRMAGSGGGELDIRLNIGDSSKSFKELEFELYQVLSKDIVEPSDLPNFDEMFTFIEFGDYITLDTFSSIVKNVYHKDIENYPCGEFRSYQIFIKSESGEVTDSILEILPEKYHVISDFELEKDNVFDKWMDKLKIGLLLIFVIIVFEVVLIKKYKANK